VAIIFALSGEVFRTDPGQPRRAANLFDLLPAGTALETGPGSHLALAFATGRRWELGGGARVTLGTTDLTDRSGDVRSLPKLPRLPRLAPIRKEDHAGQKAGAVTIRGERIAGLYPGRGATALAEATVLRFQMVDPGARYQVEVQDGHGAVVFSAVTSDTAVKVPADHLRPGASYHWAVRTLGRPCGDAHGETSFRTLDRDTAQCREALRRAASRHKDLTALLAGIDKQIGLLAEARDELRTAAAASPEDSGLRTALAQTEEEVDQDGETGAPPSDPPEPGMIVEEVKPGAAAARAGLVPGDLLQRWERAASPPANPLPAEGRLDSPFDLTEVEDEQAPRGAIRLTGLREGAAHRWELPPGDWELRARPLWPGAQLGDYERGRRSIAAGNVTEGIAAWQQMGSRLAADGEAESSAWLFRRIAEAQIENGDRAGAKATYENLLATLGPLGSPAIVAQLRGKLAGNLREMGGLERSVELFREALEARRSAIPESITEARLLSGLGRALAMQGDLQSAQRQLSNALSLCERLAPGSLVVSQMLGNLGIIEGHLGNLPAAEDLQRRALEIDRKLNPESLGVANDLTNLAGLERSRRDFAAAAEDYTQALSLREQLDPDSSSVATALDNLAGVLLSRDDPATAEASAAFERSLVLRRRLHQSDREIVDTLIGLGTAAWARHDDAPAEQWLRHALAIDEKESPDSLEYATVLNNLADVLLDQGRLAEAESLCRRALVIFQNRAPSTGQEATADRDLAVIVRRAGRAGEARALYEQALLAIDRVGWQLAGSGQGRSALLSSYASYYREAVDLLVELGRPEEAFAVLERSRARDLLGLLAERKLNFEGTIPKDLESERLTANADYEHVLARFAALSGDSPPAERKELQTRLDEARLHQDVVRSKIRATSPRLAALRDPEPLRLTAVSEALDPGTALLSYSIGDERSYLFVIGPGRDHFAVFPLPAGQKTLREEVRRLRALIDQREGGAQAFLRAAGRLTSLLLAPAAREIATADRLLVVPDGPLHLLPFAALGDPSAPRFLAESKPIHTAASATLFAELKNHRRANRAPRLLAFGDPVYPAAAPSHDPVLRGAVREGMRLDPLPGTRAEVQALGALFPDDAQIFLGAEATEERAKAAGPERTFVHFACHALVNERFPLESALVLSIPEHPREGQDNGLLQAWEIFEQVRLDADLVTLAACDSALGKEQAGEGLLGLTRAFQYAGARSVVASLWSVDDSSTSVLMKRFYGHLKLGETKDEALRAAQLDLIRGPAAISHPYHWAAFQLTGDWK
jgi:CHAT domain-containing protein/Tfp pilus assembly protein PilF